MACPDIRTTPPLLPLSGPSCTATSRLSTPVRSGASGPKGGLKRLDLILAHYALVDDSQKIVGPNAFPGAYPLRNDREVVAMGRMIFGMMQSLDGYIQIEGQSCSPPPPGPILHRHFNDHARGLAGILYGRRMYEIMCYWDEDKPDWDETEHDFAQVWRSKPKWVASHSLTSVGANATLVKGS